MKFRWLVLLCMTRVFAITLEGPVILRNQSFKDLVVHGNAQLDHVEAEQLVVNGNLKAAYLTAQSVRVNGMMEGQNVTASHLDVSGPLSLASSEIIAILALSSTSIHGLKIDKLSLFSSKENMLCGVKANEVVVKTKSSAKLILGRACYINSIRFDEASGTVLMSKDHSYVADIQNGALK